MSRKYKFGDNDKLYFISFAVVHWIDLFIRKEYKDVLIESWKYCQKEKELEIYSWCIMSSHAHMIIGSSGRNLDKIVGEMKSLLHAPCGKLLTNIMVKAEKNGCYG